MLRSAIVALVLYLGAAINAAEPAAPELPRTPAGNRPPLAPRPYAELPLGAVKPLGWLRHMLERMAEGMSGHLDEWYPQVVGPRNGWLGGDGDAWERGPYWIDGLYPLAVMLDSEELRGKAMPWIEWVLTHQREDGYIGPRPTAVAPSPERGLQRDKQEDWWPRMVMLKILQQHFQATGDPRVISCLRNYFRYQLAELPRAPLDRWSWWAPQRGADNALVVLWLYNETGERWLLDLATLLQKQTLPYSEIFAKGQLVTHERTRFGPPFTPSDSFHCVNLAQGLKSPLVFGQLAAGPPSLDATRRALIDLVTVHGQPHGLFGGDEGLHGRDLDRGSELCTAVEMMFSFEKMIEISGAPEFADWLEKIAFNPLPAQVTADFEMRQYYQQANQVQVTPGRRSFFDHHNGTALVYGLLTGYPCCTTNLHQGWPKFAHHLWLRSVDDGLAALVYSASEVKTAVKGVAVTITERTDYPFDERIEFRLTTAAPVTFPLHLRIPSWCMRPEILVNGEPMAPAPTEGGIRVISRQWQTGDRVELVLPMTLRKSFWHERSVAIERGPLVYALRIEEEWSQVQPGDRQSGFRECRPASPWNYALLRSAIDRLDQGFVLTKKPGPLAPNPWTLASAPLELRAQAVRLPTWTLSNDSAGRVPMSPVPRAAVGETESIRLIPYGCTTLRVSGFPFVAD